MVSVVQERFSAAHHADDASSTEAHIREAVSTPAFRIAGMLRAALARPLFPLTMPASEAAALLTGSMWSTSLMPQRVGRQRPRRAWR